MKIEAFMTTDVHSLNLDSTVREAITMITAKRISGAPVLDRSNKVMTVVSEGDLLKLAAGGAMEKKISACLSSLTPTEDLLTLKKTDTFADAYRIFLHHSVHRIIITDSSGGLQGIVSRSNVLRLLVDIKANTATTVGKR